MKLNVNLSIRKIDYSGVSMSEANKEKREAIQASTQIIDELKVKRDGIVVQMEELKVQRDSIVDLIKVERDKIATLRSEIIK
jgi:uncharacterized coiled-coil DUF342 family protein